MEHRGHPEVAHDDDPLEEAGQPGGNVPGGHRTVPERRMSVPMLLGGRASYVVTASALRRLAPPSRVTPWVSP